MIRRLVLFQPMTDDEARAATAWTGKLGDRSLVLSFQPSPVKMRLLLFDETNSPGKNRRMAKNMIRNADAADGQAAQVMRAAKISGRVIFNVYSEQIDSKTATSDLLFTVGLPDGRACAFLDRGNPFITEASKAGTCLWMAWRELGRQGERPPDEDVRALFWPKKKPRNRQASEQRVISYIEDLLAALPV